jgi:hypothetical protein
MVQLVEVEDEHFQQPQVAPEEMQAAQGGGGAGRAEARAAL